MRNLSTFLGEYALSHQHPVNQKIHKICVPLITWSLLAFLHTFEVMGLPLSLPFAGVVLLFYLSFRSWALVGVMALATFLMFLSFLLVPELRLVSVLVFILSWIGQFYGHHLEGKKPSFLKDLVFLFIGPLWVAQAVLPKRWQVKL